MQSARKQLTARMDLTRFTNRYPALQTATLNLNTILSHETSGHFQKFIWEKFDVVVFLENEKYLLMKKNYFCYFNYCVCSSYQCSFIGFDYFSPNFGDFLKFWGNPEIQDGRYLVIMT